MFVYALVCFALSDECLNYNQIVGRSYEQSNFNVSNCFFQRFGQYSGSGGVCYISTQSASYSMFISFSTFIDCKVSSYGGAIYFYSETTGFSILKSVCGYNCSSNYGHFAFLRTSSSMKNEIDMVSSSMCYGSRYTIRFLFGQQRTSNLNLTLNSAGLTSSIQFYGPHSIDSSFSTIVRNNATTSMCIESTGTSGLLTYMNIIKNISPSLGIVTVSSGRYNYSSCVISDNQGILLHCESSLLMVLNSYIDHSGTSVYGTVNTLNGNSFVKAGTHCISHYSTQYCIANVIDPIIVTIRTKKTLFCSFFLSNILLL